MLTGGVYQETRERRFTVTSLIHGLLADWPRLHCSRVGPRLRDADYDRFLRISLPPSAGWQPFVPDHGVARVLALAIRAH